MILHNYIGGRWLASSSNRVLDLQNPASGETIASVTAGSEEDVAQAVAAATAAAPGWAARPLEERIAAIRRSAERVAERVPELASLESQEMGRPYQAGLQWIGLAPDSLRSCADLASRYPFTQENEPATVIHRLALGVVAVITPWNFPTNIIVDAIGPLLLAGNTVVLKPSEKTPLSAACLVDALDLPPGVLNLVQGDATAGAALAGHRDVRLVHFTGSVRAGRAVAQLGADTLRRSVLELGGKDPAIVDAGVDIARVAADVARGAFTNTGQICTSIERIYVVRDVAEAFIEALISETKKYDHTVPDPLIGPLVDRRQRDVVADHVSDAISRGATINVGGTIPRGAGNYYPATVLTDVSSDMLVMQEETFGPLAPVQVVDDFDEALRLASSTKFGLAATVYSNDPDHQRAAATIPAGLVWINQWQGAGTGVTYEPAKSSGVSTVGHFSSFDAATRATAVIATK